MLAPLLEKINAFLASLVSKADTRRDHTRTKLQSALCSCNDHGYAGCAIHHPPKGPES